MKVKLKFGHHNGERFYSAGEIMECPKNLGISLLRQGLAVFVKEEKETKQKQKQTTPETSQADNSDTQTAKTENAPDNADVQLETKEK